MICKSDQFVLYKPLFSGLGLFSNPLLFNSLDSILGPCIYDPFKMIIFYHRREGVRVDEMLFKYHVMVKGGVGGQI